MIRADFLHRAIPWSRLILRHGRFPDDLNVRFSQRISVLLIGAALVIGSRVQSRRMLHQIGDYYKPS